MLHLLKWFHWFQLPLFNRAFDHHRDATWNVLTWLKLNVIYWQVTVYKTTRPGEWTIYVLKQVTNRLSSLLFSLCFSYLERLLFFENSYYVFRKMLQFICFEYKTQEITCKFSYYFAEFWGKNFNLTLLSMKFLMNVYYLQYACLLCLLH